MSTYPLSQLGKGAEHARHHALKHLQLTHESRKLAGFAEVGLMRAANGRDSLRLMGHIDTVDGPDNGYISVIAWG